jgi:hypothetical protein
MRLPTTANSSWVQGVTPAVEELIEAEKRGFVMVDVELSSPIDDLGVFWPY